MNAEKKQLSLESVALFLLMGSVVISELLFGAFSTYAYTITFIMVLSAATLLIIGGFSKGRNGKPWQFLRPRTPFYPIFLLFSLFLVFQMTPLPADLMEIISPESYVQTEKSLPQAATPDETRQQISLITAAPYLHPVRQSLIRWVVYSIFFLSMIQVLNTRKRIEKAVLILIACGCFEAVYGFIQAYSDAPHIWWVERISKKNIIAGTYINQNHFAAFMEMVIMLSIGYAAAISTNSVQRKGNFKKRAGAFRSHINRWLSSERRFSKRAFVFFMTVAMGIGLIFSGSRGAMISFSGGLLLAGLMLGFKKRHRRKGFVVLVLFLMILLYGLQLGLERPLARFKSFDTSHEIRLQFARETMQIFEDYTLTGVGVGNFQHAFPRHQVLGKKGFMWHAHNDWIQFLAESGVAGFGIFTAGLTFYFIRMFQRWRKRKSSFAVGLGAGSFAAAAAIAVHSYSDFSLHFPANCLTLAAILAIGHNAVLLRFYTGSHSDSLSVQPMNLRWRGVVTFILAIVLVTWTGIWAIRHFVAEAYCNSVPDQTLNLDQHPPEERIRSAIAWDGSNAVYHYKLALELIQQRDAAAKDGGGVRRPLHRNPDIIRHLEMAVRLNPLNTWHHLRLGWEYASFWQSSDYYQKWLPVADLSMERAAYHVGEKTPYLHYELGNYWTMRSRTLPAESPRQAAAWNRARWHYNMALNLEFGHLQQKMKDQIKDFIQQHYKDDDHIKEALGGTR